MRSNRLLVLGTGVYQVPAIAQAVRSGLEVVACSYTAEDPGRAHASYFENVDITDKAAILDVAEAYDVAGIMTIASDVGVPAVGYVNDRLGLSGVSEHTAILCSDKIRMKEAFREEGVNTPAFLEVRSLDEAAYAYRGLGGKVVFKATDSSGSRGIIRVQDPLDVEKAYNEAFHFTKKDSIIVEQLVCGEEFGSQTLVIHGQAICNICHNDVVSHGSVTTPIGHSCPYRKAGSVEQKALAEVQKAAKALKIETAQLNCDFILDERDEVLVLEIGARVGATSLPQIVTAYTGLDWIQIAIDLAMGRLQPESLPRGPAAKAVASSLIFSTADGVVEELRMPGWLAQDSSLVYLTVDVQPGDPVRAFRLGPDRMGEVVFRGQSLEEAESKVRQFTDDLEILLR